jgi:hypothetical protein
MLFSPTRISSFAVMLFSPYEKEAVGINL